MIYIMNGCVMGSVLVYGLVGVFGNVEREKS